MHLILSNMTSIAHFNRYSRSLLPNRAYAAPALPADNKVSADETGPRTSSGSSIARNWLVSLINHLISELPLSWRRAKTCHPTTFPSTTSPSSKTSGHSSIKTRRASTSTPIRHETQFDLKLWHLVMASMAVSSRISFGDGCGRGFTTPR